MTHGSEKRVRDRHLTIRLSAEERGRIEADAERAGLMTGSYVRRVLIDAAAPRQVRRPMVERALLAKLLGELGHIGSNLNQIARDANMGEGIDHVGLTEDVQGLRRMRDAVLNALGRAP